RHIERREITRELAHALASWGARRRGDILQLGVWYLESGDHARSDVLADAARQALLADNALSVQLARAAVAAGGGFDAMLVLGWALNDAEEDEAVGVARALMTQAATDGARAQAAHLLADVLLFRAGAPDAAVETLTKTEAAIEDPMLGAE